MKLIFATLLPLAVLAGCKEDVADLVLPEPQELTVEAAGHYCQMVILEHQGPKAQVFLDGYLAPLWFSQVRDGLAYLKSEEQSADIVVLYVNDMGEAISWNEPGEDNWINAADAYYVVGSDAIGGMGAPEVTPFGARLKAEEFITNHGGEIMLLDEIPAELVLSPVEFDASDLELTQ